METGIIIVYFERFLQLGNFRAFYYRRYRLERKVDSWAKDVCYTWESNVDKSSVIAQYRITPFGAATTKLLTRFHLNFGECYSPDLLLSLAPCSNRNSPFQCFAKYSRWHLKYPIAFYVQSKFCLIFLCDHTLIVSLNWIERTNMRIHSSHASFSFSTLNIFSCVSTNLFLFYPLHIE